MIWCFTFRARIVFGVVLPYCAEPEVESMYPVPSSCTVTVLMCLSGYMRALF